MVRAANGRNAKRAASKSRETTTVNRDSGLRPLARQAKEAAVMIPRAPVRNSIAVRGSIMSTFLYTSEHIRGSKEDASIKKRYD
jgi:hypothetical protein